MGRGEYRIQETEFRIYAIRFMLFFIGKSCFFLGFFGLFAIFEKFLFTEIFLVLIASTYI